MKNVKRPIVSEVVVTAAIIAALILLINPFHLIMTSVLILTLLMILAVALIVFGVFVWREQPRDERETLYGMKAGRLSYFLGAAVLVVAIIYQSLTHDLDIWLAVVLGVMVLTKLGVNVWSRHR